MRVHVNKLNLAQEFLDGVVKDCGVVDQGVTLGEVNDASELPLVVLPLGSDIVIVRPLEFSRVPLLVIVVNREAVM